MNVFVFGAGASLGSQDPHMYGRDSPLRAPLVDQLFDLHYQQHGANILVGDDYSECRDGTAAAGSAEKWLTQQWERIEQLSQPQSKAAEWALFGRLAFYIWHFLQLVSATYTDASGYSLFMKKLRMRDEPFGLISFNYDTLLDRSVINRFGTPVNGQGY